MPIYEYRCEKCGHRFERWQKMSDPDPDQCPECKADKVERLISAVGFRLKGSGWYETDFKKDNRHNIAGDTGGDRSGEKSESSSSSGSKDSGNEKKKTSGESSSSKSKKKPAGKSGDTAA